MVRFQVPVRLVFGAGSFERLGELARELGFRRTLLVSDRGLLPAGYVERAAKNLANAGVEVFPFHDFGANPDSSMIETGRAFAAPLQIDSLIGLGGGSSMDCAKGINFVLSNGGRMEDYWGYGKAAKPMLPMIGIPTTAGTGSEAQTFALISNPQTHVKMACGDPKAAFQVALLDPALTVSQPAPVRAAAGYDAVSHAVESFVTRSVNPLSESYAREAWRLLSGSFVRSMAEPEDLNAQGAMLLGAHFAGLAIENSMLGATHACANPLTARYGTVHGVAIAAMLVHVVRWNAAGGVIYRELDRDLPQRLEYFASAASLRTNLHTLNVPREDLPSLAGDASKEWTGTHNPRPFDAAGALEVYQCAY